MASSLHTACPQFGLQDVFIVKRIKSSRIKMCNFKNCRWFKSIFQWSKKCVADIFSILLAKGHSLCQMIKEFFSPSPFWEEEGRTVWTIYFRILINVRFRERTIFNFIQAEKNKCSTGVLIRLNDASWFLI